MDGWMDGWMAARYNSRVLDNAAKIDLQIWGSKAPLATAASAALTDCASAGKAGVAGGWSDDAGRRAFFAEVQSAAGDWGRT